MSDQDMFPENKDSATPQPEDLLKLVTREDGTPKYATLEDLAKGAAHAQTHLATVLAEKRELEAKLKALEEGKEKAAVEKALENLENKQPAPTQPAGVSKEDLLALLEDVEKERAARANVDVMKSDLVRFAGSEEAASKLFKEKAASIGVDTGTLTALAAKSPAAVRKLLGIEDKPSTPSKGASTVRTTGMPEPQPERKRVMLGGATSADIVEAFRKHKPQ